MGLFDRKPSPPRERTSDERERARAEREARRAAREGRPVELAVPPPLEAPPPEPGTEPAPPPEPAAEPSPQPPAAPAPEPAPIEPQPPAAQVVDTEPEPPPEEPEPLAKEPESGFAEPADDDHDQPSVVLDREPIEDWSALDQPDPDTTRRRRLGRRLGESSGAGDYLPPIDDDYSPPPRHGRRLLAAVAVLLALVAGWLVLSMFQPFHGDGNGRVMVMIPRGATVADAGRRLAQQDVIASPFFFRVRAKLSGGDVKPGNYPFRRDISYSAALKALEQGPPKPRTTPITITEGRTRREANRLLAKTSLRGSYLAATRRSPLLSPRAYGAPRKTPHLEGFLFPSTYEVRVGAPIGDLVRKQLTEFRKQFARVDMREARRRKLTPYEVLIVASMIEREASIDRERPLVAAVIYNRLKRGEPLGIDATLRYALDNQDRALRQSELALDSPYNTRNRQGLPPTPIGNPGMESIQAAAHPAKSDALFYVIKPGTCGEHAFSSSYEQFQRDSARYDAAREAAGGRSPVKCD